MIDLNKYAEKVNVLVNKAVKEIKIANAKAESAEKLIESFRVSAQEEIQKAFNEGFKQGYKKGIESVNSGGTSKTNEDTKLVLKNNN